MARSASRIGAASSPTRPVPRYAFAVTGVAVLTVLAVFAHRRLSRSRR